MRFLDRLALPFLALLLAAVPAWSQGQWQGQEMPEAAERVSSPFHYRIGDTGGRGGGFAPEEMHAQLWDAFFWNRQIGWACGFGGVFRTEDGGWRWTRMKPQGGWYHVQMTGPREIWLLEGFHGQAMGRLWHSNDDGLSWTELLPGKLLSASDLVCRGNLRAVLCGDFTSFWSLDGGENWVPLPFSGTIRMAVPGDIRSGTGFVAYVLCHGAGQPAGARVFKSIDSGRSWKELVLPKGLPWPKTIFFATSRQGWIGLNDGVLLATADGGESWEKLPFPERRPIQALWFDSLGRGYAAPENSDMMRLETALLETPDGGRSWETVLSGSKNVNAFFSLGPDRIWAVGNVPGFMANDMIVFFER
ncbi:MAG: YCF48-related protein [Methylacidiphilaceae bacterium]|nr:YCF48-related protein [Candidatus Methylacidiphilaceae bacterium]